MGAQENKQRIIFNQINKYKRQAYELLINNRLFKAENNLVIKGTAITAGSEEGEYKRSHVLTEFYKNNSSCFLFKLIDDSIITLYLLTDSSGALIKFSYGFCSCPYVQDILIEELDDETNNLLVNKYPLNDDEYNRDFNNKEELLTNELKIHFEKCCNGDKKLVSSMMDLARNPIYIRCDYDSKNVSDNHPEYHLTLNFITESRLKIDANFSFLDFVIFILDIVYGKKQNPCFQFMHLSRHKI